MMDREKELSVGDMVGFRKDYGVIFGGCEVLGFGNVCNSGRCVYIESDCYWFGKGGEEVRMMRGGE